MNANIFGRFILCNRQSANTEAIDRYDSVLKVRVEIELHLAQCANW